MLNSSCAGSGRHLSDRAGSSSHARDTTSYSWSDDRSTALTDALEAANRLELHVRRHACQHGSM